MRNIANQNVISKKSALSMQAKVNSLVSDLVRVIRNGSEQCNNEERLKHVQHFIHKMHLSGYAREHKVLLHKKAKKVFENIVERGRAGQCPMYRGEYWQRREKDKRKLDKKCNW